VTVVNKAIISILEALSNQIDSNELATALKADNFEGEYALSDDGIASILNQTKSLLSINSAVNNAEIIEKVSKDLYPKHMKSALSKVEDNLKPILDKLGIDYSQREFISDAIQDIAPKLSEMSSGDNKELIESLNKDVKNGHDALTKQADEFQQQLQKRDDDILADKIRGIYKSKATEKQWAEAYSMPDVKTAILGQVWNKINAKAHLKLSESGDIIPMQKEFPDKELYDGNKVQTFQSLLEPEFEAYLKKSTPENVNTTGKPSDTQHSEADLKRMAEHKRQLDRAG
jgi:hypothetical protein